MSIEYKNRTIRFNEDNNYELVLGGTTLVTRELDMITKHIDDLEALINELETTIKELV